MSIALLVQRARLLSGLVLMAFVVSHLANLALGILSLAAMEDGRSVLLKPWQTVTGETLLAAAALVHTVLGLVSIAARRNFAMSRTDGVQLLLGLLTPPLLLNHVATLRLSRALVEAFSADYGLVLAIYWSFAPIIALQQLFAVVFVWIHGAIGLYTWLVVKPVWRRIGPVLVPVLFAVPILALLGFAEGGRHVVIRLAHDPDWLARIKANLALIDGVRADVRAAHNTILIVYSLTVLTALVVFAARAFWYRVRRIPVAYDGGVSVFGRAGLSILDVSLLNDVPHAHVCSARGRCGTCLVQIVAGAEALTAITDLERATLTRIHAPPDGRLACQARLSGSAIEVDRLVPAYADAADSRFAKGKKPAGLLGQPVA